MRLPKGDTFADGRFVVVRGGVGSAIIAEDREKGDLVEVIEIAEGEGPHLRHRVAVEEMIARLDALDDPRLLPPRWAHPLCVPYEPSDPDPPGSLAELADAALALIACVGVPLSKGIEVDPARAWLVDGAIQLPAPTPALYWRRWAVDGAESRELLEGVWRWYRPRRVTLTGDPGAEALPHSCPASSVQELSAHFVGLGATSEPPEGEWPRLERPAPSIDRVIELAEKRYRAVGKSEPAEGYRVPPADLLLASAYHHRACLRWRAGQADEARSDVARAVEVDPYPRYLTTAALFETGVAATAWHDRAVAAVGDVEPGIDWTNDDLRSQIDDEDAARTLHARGVHRWRAGNRDGAAADLRASLQFVNDPRVEAWLARVTG